MSRLLILPILVLCASCDLSSGQLFGPLMSLAGGLGNLNPFQGLANSLTGGSGGVSGLFSSLRGSASSLSGIRAPMSGLMAGPMNAPMPPPLPYTPFGGFASPSDIQYGPQGVPMLSPLELAEIMNAQSNQNDGGFDGPYNGPQRPAQPSQGQPVYGRRPSGPPNQGPRQYDRQPESEENYDEDNNSGYEDGRNDNFASSPPRGHASSGYRQPAPQEDERDQGGYSNEHPEDNRGYAAPQRPREPERPQSVSRYRVRTPSYDNRNRDAQPDTRGSRNNENFRPVDEDARYNRQGSTPITAAGGFDVPPRNSYRVNINNRQNNRNNVPHPDRGSSSYAYNTMHDQRPRESSREEDDDREDERPNDYGRSPSEQRPQSTYGYYNSEDYSQPSNNNNNANNNYPNNNYSNQVNNNYSNSYNGDNNGSGGFQPSTRNFAPSHHHHHHHHHQGSNEFIDNRNRNRRRFYPNHHNQRNHY